MELPFTQAEFFRVFAEYNEAVWPAQPALTGLALLALVAAVLDDRRWDRVVGLALAALWLWMGVAYHWLHFTGINPAAWLFGGFFVLQGALFLGYALRTEPLRFRPRANGYGIFGGILIGYALVAYPLLATAFGHAWPARPTFGLPCPTTIFTMGLLL